MAGLYRKSEMGSTTTYAPRWAWYCSSVSVSRGRLILAQLLLPSRIMITELTEAGLLFERINSFIGQNSIRSDKGLVFQASAS